MANVKSFIKKAAAAPKAPPPSADAPTRPTPAIVPQSSTLPPSTLPPSTLSPSKGDRRATDISDAIVPCRTREEFAQEIRYHWNRSRKEFLSIGRYLNRAKDTLAHGEFEAMIVSDMPFSVETAYRFRAVAEAIDSGRLALEMLPGAESVAYQIVTMKPDELERAKAVGLIRPDVTRRQLIDFKQSLRPAKTGAVPDRRKALLADYARCKAKLAEIRAELLRDHGVDPERDSGVTIDLEAEDVV
ncbi:DUF3102 domain-containing protein [Azospirillum sp.]|uniref:DUF3102 domain-containing protein n=1 Tax=Azospirillum sp. TaxID=34012 RepID=UPI002607CE6F|nr:DUF3102 domain-containing protein [Azospirillum sp.]